MNRRQPIGVDLLRTAARAKGFLDPQALARLAGFVQDCALATGGFRGRGSQGDLYYTQFGLSLAGVLGVRPDRGALAAFLDRHAPAQLDLPHLAAFGQCQRLLHLPVSDLGSALGAAVAPLVLPFLRRSVPDRGGFGAALAGLGVPRAVREACLPALHRFRSRDGGYAETPGADRGTAYGLYLALLCGEALGEGVPDAGRARGAAEAVLAAELAAACPGVSPLAAALLSVQALGGTVPEAAARDVLRSCQAAEGGSRAHPRAPLADLLSTAVDSFALRRLGTPLRAGDARATAHFVQSLWGAEGGFCGSAADPVPDCEYTFYGLLALGALEP